MFVRIRLYAGVNLLWRLRRATTIETGLFDIQADHLNEFRQARQARPTSRELVHAMFGLTDPVSFDSNPGPRSSDPTVYPAADLAHCFLRLTNLPGFVLDRLSRYEVTLWRQVDQILLMLDSLDRYKPQGRRRRSSAIYRAYSSVDNWVRFAKIRGAVV